ncbi:MAG: exodeoxyribonuclease VII small subunit [Sporolactobacillus sp.]|jgi:exodeoxyribonuclease VII small subunit|nr:exodeoxyribonuclease VII small subunit [Sporolactobacillus sp.]MCI1882457.1 exodeoxyribonuclease VII small subunit [Sporolactobacillus sp.]
MSETDNQSDEKQVPSFEQAMEQLEAIVRRLEENDVPLEKTIDLFQQGMTLSKLCHDKLESAGKRMDRMIDANGESHPFSPGEDDPS